MADLLKYCYPIDFVAEAIGRMYSKGHCVVINPLFVRYTALKKSVSHFDTWFTELIMDSALRDEHPVCQQRRLLMEGAMVTYTTDDLGEAEAVYDCFAEQQVFVALHFCDGKLVASNINLRTL